MGATYQNRTERRCKQNVALHWFGYARRTTQTAKTIVLASHLASIWSSLKDSIFLSMSFKNFFIVEKSVCEFCCWLLRDFSILSHSILSRTSFHNRNAFGRALVFIFMTTAEKPLRISATLFWLGYASSPVFGILCTYSAVTHEYVTVSLLWRMLFNVILNIKTFSYGSGLHVNSN